eukprot:TRINITY_DN806_c3_g1_i2.p1 TRINITY_DN806_c3_g1~~TRINITY_DN806_c3_g1_i2.p1  ORF type:complete len:678 (+),score=143.18 TRINITY_DN806_c3_g1_i2:54-2036(+)
MGDQEEEVDAEADEQQVVIPEIWKFADPESTDGGAVGPGPQIGKIVKYLNEKEEEELLEELKKTNPETGQSLLMWATLQQKFVLVEWLVKKAARSAFVFDDKELGVYDKFVEKRKEREQEEKERLEALEENGEPEDPEEEKETPPPIHELVIAEYADDEGSNPYKIRAIGELGIYQGQRNAITNTKTGLGQSLYPNGDCYIGQYSDNKRQGIGCYWWASSGEIYIGNWMDNHRHASGRMLHPDGGKYYGLWKMDEKCGKGRFTYPTGDTYSGDWVAGKRSGQGTYTVAADMSVFSGAFHTDNFVTGEWRLSGGVRYYGAFDQFKPVGKGVFLHRFGQEGAFTQDGIYTNGEWQPFEIKRATDSSPSFSLSVQGKDLSLSATPDLKISLMTLIRVANFRPFEDWVKKIETPSSIPGGYHVNSLKVSSVEWVPGTKILRSVTVKVSAFTDNQVRHPSPTSFVFAEDNAVLVPVLRCNGEEVAIFLKRPVPSAGDLDASVLIDVTMSAGGELRSDYLDSLNTIGINVTSGNVVKLSKISSGETRFAEPHSLCSAFEVLFFTQEVTPDFFSTLNDRLAGLTPHGGLWRFAAGDLEDFSSKTPVTSSYSACHLVKKAVEAGTLPSATSEKMRPPTPPPPVPEPRPELPDVLPEEQALEMPKEAET